MNREQILRSIEYELEEGVHTYTMCSCGEYGCRSTLCVECLSKLLKKEEGLGIVPDHKEDKDD